MKKLMQRFKNERGLTLVELLAVIVILAIIAIIAFVFIGGIIENSKKDAHVSNAQQIISAAKLHESTTGEIGVTVKNLKEGDYLDQILDPWDKGDYGEDALSATVTKDDDGYKINNFVPNDTSNCKSITASEKTLAEEGRKLCD